MENETTQKSISIDEIRTIFNKFDKNEDGKISCHEFMENLHDLGTAVTLEGVKSMMQDIDKDHNGYIDFDEFVEFMTCGSCNKNSDENKSYKELKDAFDLYDMDKNGLISASELHKVMKMLKIKCSMRDCTNMIRRVDQDGDGNVNFEEFKVMMNQGLL